MFSDYYEIIIEHAKNTNIYYLYLRKQNGIIEDKKNLQKSKKKGIHEFKIRIYKLKHKNSNSSSYKIHEEDCAINNSTRHWNKKSYIQYGFGLFSFFITTKHTACKQWTDFWHHKVKIINEKHRDIYTMYDCGPYFLNMNSKYYRNDSILNVISQPEQTNKKSMKIISGSGL